MGKVISLSKERIKEHSKNYKSTKIKRAEYQESFSNNFVLQTYFAEFFKYTLLSDKAPNPPYFA